MLTPNIPNYLLYFRDEMALSTWILWGACLQSLLVLILPFYVAVMPAILVLGTRLVYSTLQIQGLLPYSGSERVNYGRMTAQIPNEDGSFPAAPSDKDVVVFIIATRSSHPKGRFAPGLEEITDYFRKMWQDLSANREKWGCMICRNRYGIRLTHVFRSWQNPCAPCHGRRLQQHDGLDLILEIRRPSACFRSRRRTSSRMGLVERKQEISSYWDSA